MSAATVPHSAAGSSSALDSPHERAYGTFEVSVIEVDSDSEQAPLKPSKSTDFDAEERDDHRHTCAGDCCALVSFVWLPFRLATYKVVAFHVVNALFALAASAWTVLFYATKLVLAPVAPALHLAPALLAVEAATLRVLLHADAALFNFVCPRAERIRVYNSSTSAHDGYSAQLYFAGSKLLCSAVPGAVAALTFLWTIRNFVVVVLASFRADAAQADPLALVENDVLILLALVAVYAAASLTKVFAAISRHITIFFCAEYLLYASPL